MTDGTKGLAEDFCRSVYEMMVGFGQTEDIGWKSHREQEPEEPNPSTLLLRSDLIWEEYMEFVEASRNGDLVEVADALGDLMVVIAGTAVAYNIDLPAVLAEIQRSNLSKIDPDTGMVHKRDDGKVLKPEGWTAPEIASVM